MRSLIFPDHRESFFGDGAHRLYVLFQLEIEHGPHVQTAFGGMRVHGAAGAMPCEDGVESLGVVGKMRQRHRAILDERNWFTLLLHRHHDVEAGGAKFCDGRLQHGIDNLNHTAPFALRVAPAEAELAHQLAELLQASDVLGLILFGKFHDQHRIWVTAHGGPDDRLEHRNIAAECDHGAIDKLHRDGTELNQMLGGIHRFIKAAEVTNAEHLVADNRPQLQFDLRGEGEGAFRTYKQMRHVVGRIARDQGVQIVATDAALHFRKFVGDFACLSLAQRQHIAK